MPLFMFMSAMIVPYTAQSREQAVCSSVYFPAAGLLFNLDTLISWRTLHSEQPNQQTRSSQASLTHECGLLGQWP